MASSSRIKSGLVEVDGLAELNRALKRMGPEFPRKMRDVNKKVATFVAQDAAAAARSLGGVAAKTAPSIKPSAGTVSAGVRFGGSAYPFAGGAEFGALAYKQFDPWRGISSDAGYFVYPSIRRDEDRIVTEYSHGVEDLMQEVGLTS